MELWRHLHHSISLTSRPVISATTHDILQLGQPLRDTGEKPGREPVGRGGGATPCRDDKGRRSGGRVGSQEKKRKSAPETKGGGNSKRQCVTAEARLPERPATARPSKKFLAVTAKKNGPLQIKDLIDRCIIKPGKEKVAVHYKGLTYKGDLCEDGTIVYEGRQFHAASAFSVHVKRLLTPNKQGDDGWKSVHVDGRSLEEWRAVYRSEQSQFCASGKDPDSVGCARHKKECLQRGRGGLRQGCDPPDPSDVQDCSSEPENGVVGVATDHWVQCSRCEVWRVVPLDFWEAVQNDTRDDWYCEDAEWDIIQCPPYTGACTN